MKANRAFLVLPAMLLFSMSSYAESAPTVLDVSAITCSECWPGVTQPAVSVNAVMTVLPATGTFYDPWHQNYFTGTELEVVAINGMLNSSDPISMIRAPHGDGSWLNSDYSLGYVNFSAGGFNSVLFNDSAFNLLDTATGGGYGTNTPVIWNAVQAPEPPSVLLLALGLLGLPLKSLNNE
jgi:hypothetical protein